MACGCSCHHDDELCEECCDGPDVAAALEVLADIDAWLGNSEGLMIEDVVEWRDKLAAALGQPSRE